MDKKLILATAGSGKTTALIDQLDENKYTLIVTYTNFNYDNIISKVAKKNPKLLNTTKVMTYYSFLYNFCFKPFLADILPVKGIDYEKYKLDYISQSNIKFYIKYGRLRHNRIAYLLQQRCMNDIIHRIESHFDNFFIDEVQDIAGRDFNFILALSNCNVNQCYVGDFYQHTFDTSTDGMVNSNLFNDYDEYLNKFAEKGFLCDTTTLSISHRCCKEVCEFISNKLRIEIVAESKNIVGYIKFVTDVNEIQHLWNDNDIIKLHYMNSSKYGSNHLNWGKVKGLDCFKDVCVILNKQTVRHLSNLHDLSQQTKNKLYVAMTRSRRNVYFIEETDLKKLKII